MDERQEDTASPSGEDQAAEIQKILTKCMDAPGYVIFAGILRSEGGNLFLDCDYRRYHINLDDLIKTFQFVEETVGKEADIRKLQ